MSFSYSFVEGGRKGNIALYKAVISNFIRQSLVILNVKSCKVGMHSQLTPWLCINGGRSCGMYSRDSYHPW